MPYRVQKSTTTSCAFQQYLSVEIVPLRMTAESVWGVDWATGRVLYALTMPNVVQAALRPWRWDRIGN